MLLVATNVRAWLALFSLLPLLVRAGVPSRPGWAPEATGPGVGGAACVDQWEGHPEAKPRAHVAPPGSWEPGRSGDPLRGTSGSFARPRGRATTGRDAPHPGPSAGQLRASRRSLTGGGSGTFVPGSDPAVGYIPRSVAVGDVDGDGDLDLLTANEGSGTVSVRLNDGQGHFAPGSDLTVGKTTYSVAVGDVDGDGDLDVLTANGYSGLTGTGAVSVRLNDGHGSFSAGPDPAVQGAPESVAVGDVDGDGDLDLLTVNGTYTIPGTGIVNVRLNDGHGTFSAGSDPTVGSGPVSVAVGDVDGDGDLDLLTANDSNGTVSVRLNDGHGTFAGGSDPAVGNRPYSVVVGDVDGDGDLDLLAANLNSNTVSVRLNDGHGSFAGGSDPAVGRRPYSVR